MRNNLARINQVIINIFTVDNSWILVIILLLALVVRLNNFTGIFRFDSFFYAQLSYFLSQGNLNSFFFESNNFFAIGRLLIYFPTAFFYKVFGVNDFTSVAFILLASLANIVVVYFLGRKLVNKKVGLLAAFLMAIYPLDVFHATQYLPDGLIVVFLSLSALAFLYGESEIKTNRIALFYFLSGAFIGLAQYVRENAFFFVFVYVVYILVKKNLKSEYFWIVVGGSTVFTLAGVFFLIGTGDFFFQINQVLSQFSSSRERISEGTDRVVDWLGFSKVLLSASIFRPFSLLIIVSLFYIVFFARKKISLILIWFISMMFYLEVISQFHGLAKHARYLSLVSVPIVLFVSVFLVDFFKKYRVSAHLVVVFLLAFAIVSFIPVRSLSTQLVSNSYLSTNRDSAKLLATEPTKPIYIQNLKHKGYIFNYVFGFDSLNYNSFQRARVEGTDSLLRDWDGVEEPVKNSYVLIDSKSLKKRVRGDWELISRDLEMEIYLTSQ